MKLGDYVRQLPTDKLLEINNAYSVLSGAFFDALSADVDPQVIGDVAWFTNRAMQELAERKSAGKA